MDLALLSVGGGLVMSIIKVVVAFQKGNSSQAAKIIWDTFNKFVKNRKENFEDIFKKSLRETIKSQQTYLDAQCEGGAKLFEKKFLKALSASNVNFQDVEILAMEEEEFIQRLAKILQDHLALPGIRTEDTLGICRKLMEELRNKLKNKINANHTEFAQLMINEMHSLGEDLASVKKELQHILTKMNLSDEMVHQLLNEIAKDVQETKKSVEDIKVGMEVGSEEHKEILESTKQLHAKLDHALQKKSLGQILDEVEQRLKGMDFYDRKIAAQFQTKVEKIIGILKEMGEEKFIEFVLSIKVPFTQSDRVNLTDLSSFPIDFLCGIVRKLAYIIVKHPDIEFTYQKGLGLKVDDKILALLYSNDSVVYDQYDEVVLSFVRELKESQFENLDTIDRVIVGSCRVDECDGTGAILDLGYIIDEISNVYPDEEEEFANFKTTYDYEYHCKKCFNFKRKDYAYFKQELTRLLGG